jgi:hypothetical protein
VPAVAATVSLHVIDEHGTDRGSLDETQMPNLDRSGSH